MRSFFITTIILFLLTACGTATQPAAPTAMITPTATKEATATAKPTNTPEATATKEIKQFSFCTPETVFDHQLTVEDLRAPLHDWLETQSKPFDPETIRTDVPLIKHGTTEVGYNWDTSPNFTGKNEGKEPFRRYVVGYIEYTGPNGEKYTGVVFATEYFDTNNPNVNPWVRSVTSFSGDYWTKENILKWVKIWQNNMNTTPILANDLSSTTGKQDPLIAKTFAEFDAESVLLQFANNNNAKPGGKMDALSDPDMIWGTEIHNSTSGNNWWN